MRRWTHQWCSMDSGLARAAVDYEIGITGAVPEDILSGIEDVVAVVQPLTTILTGAVTDQAALHGLINQLHGAGLELLEVRRSARQPATGPPIPHDR